MSDSACYRYLRSSATVYTSKRWFSSITGLLMRLFEHDAQAESSFQVAPFDAADKSAHLAIERSHPSFPDSAAAPGYEHSSHLGSHRRSGILDVVQWHTRNLSILIVQQGDALARAWLLPTESKDDTGTKAQVVLNIGSRVGESGTEITDIYGTKGKVLGQPDI